MFLFSSQPGVVGAMVTGGAMPFSIIVGGGDPRVQAFPTPAVAKSILTGYRVHKKAGFGLTHTLMERIYAHIFGERAGAATVSGIGFAGMCNTDGKHVGFDVVHSYYENLNASRNGLPVRLVFGQRTSLSGMMSDLDYGVEDPSTGLGMFQFQFAIFPRKGPVFPIWETEGDLGVVGGAASGVDGGGTGDVASDDAAGDITNSIPIG